MGHKINPTGLRVGVNKTHKSYWYSDKSYAEELAYDVKARKLLRTKFVSSGISDLIISKDSKAVEVVLTVARPGVVIGRGGKSIEDVKKELSKIYKKLNINVKIVEAKNPDSDAAIVAYNVGEQCVRRIPPKQAMMKEITKIKASKDVKGAKIWVSGRIKGTEIARTEKAGYGSVPLQTLRANIDYAFHVVRVPNAGLHGVKVWIYKGEKLDNE